MLSQYRGLPKQVYIICFARIVTSMGAFIFSMNSLLMTTVLGLSEVATGYIMLVLSAFDIAGTLVGGRLADRYGRKKTILMALSVETAALILGGFLVRNLAVIACEAVVMFCFAMFFPIVGAMITDKTADGKREESFSLLFLCINVGYSLGQVIAGAIFYNYTEWIFWGQGIATVLTIMLLTLFVKDDYVPLTGRGKGEVKAENLTNRNLAGMILKDMPLLLFLTAMVLTGYAYSQVSYMMPLQFSAFFGAEAASKWVAKLWIVNGVFCIIWSPVILKITKGHNEFLIIMCAAVLYMLGMGSFTFISTTTTAGLIYLLTPIWTAGEVIIAVHNGILLGSRAPESYRARYQSLYEFTNSAGRMIGPVTMGYFLIGHTYNQGWVMVAAICLAAAIIIYTAYIKDRVNERG